MLQGCSATLSRGRAVRRACPQALAWAAQYAPMILLLLSGTTYSAATVVMTLSQVSIDSLLCSCAVLWCCHPVLGVLQAVQAPYPSMPLCCLAQPYRSSEIAAYVCLLLDCNVFVLLQHDIFILAIVMCY